MGNRPAGIFRLRVDMPGMDFSCARILVYKNDCAQMHGHNFQVTVELEGEVNDDCFVVDLSEFEPMLRGICTALDNHLLVPAQNPQLQISQTATELTVQFRERKYVLPLNEAILLDLPNASVEMLAYYLCNEIHRKLTEAGYMNVTAITAEVAETPGNSGLYRKVIAPAL